ncbi:bacteriocin-protection protein, YdeI/OmpD-associated family, partial [Acinetobacter baumannii]
MLWFAPRKPKSGWSRLNKERVERRTAAGLMAAPGLRKVEASIADGSWTKLDMVEELTVPDDLQAHFDLHPGSRAN